MELDFKLKLYYMTALLSLVIAVVGFSYNAWRLEVSEENSNIRTASFEVLANLAELEQIIYAAHYDKNTQEGSPRKAWVKVGLIVDLSTLISQSVEKQSLQLKEVWSTNWERISTDQDATNNVIEEIDLVRKEIKHVMSGLD